VDRDKASFHDCGRRLLHEGEHHKRTRFGGRLQHRHATARRDRRMFQADGRQGSEHSGATADVEAWLSIRPAMRGSTKCHIVTRAGFQDGSSAPIVVFSVGRKAFGFLCGGPNLRALRDANLIKRTYAQGVRAPT